MTFKPAKKTLNTAYFNKYLEHANKTNQFTNYGFAVQLLEHRAREMLKISSDKAVIATSSGMTALSTALNAFESGFVATQDFTYSFDPNFATTFVDFHSDIDILDLTKVSDFEDSGVDTLVVTNCFGHLQNLQYIEANFSGKVIYDNAATPYSFSNGINSCNYGNASIISLHHTKPIGFGEGGLLIIDVEYEEFARSIIAFGKTKQVEVYNNFKMSELSAAGILQWWDQFKDINLLQQQYLYNYKQQCNLYDGKPLTHSYIDDIFFPSCLPVIHSKPILNVPDTVNAGKYYKPLRGLPNSKKLYDHILCYAIHK